MSDDPNMTNATQQIFIGLQSATTGLPIAQLLAELQIAVERLSFSDVFTPNTRSAADLSADIKLLFEGEISDDLLSFVQWLAENNLLGVLAGRTGRLFLNYCMSAFEKITEVKFITPIHLSSEMQIKTTQSLRNLYPAPARIVYRVMPSITAGFILQDDTQTIDRTLRSKMTTSIPSYLKQERVVHG